MRKKTWILISLAVVTITQVSFSGMLARLAHEYIENSRFRQRPVDVSLRPKISKDRSDAIFRGEKDFYVFSVIAIMSSAVPTWDRFVVTGWERNYAEKHSYLCCYLFQNGGITWSKQLEKRRFAYATPPIHATRVLCGFNNRFAHEFPVATAVVLDNQTCGTDGEFHSVFYVTKHPSRSYNFAVHAKVVYGEKDPAELIEWLEYQRFFRVDRVIVYPYELGEAAKRVLDYYVDIGLVQTIPFARVPLYYDHPRMFGVPEVTMIHDEQVINFDAQERLRAYKYFTIIDTDEFILPIDPNITSFTRLMELLLKKYHQAASFTMYNHLHLRTWGKTDESSKLMITQYGNHTETLINAPKLLHVTDRIEPGSATIHGVKGHKGYKVDASDVVLKHYRECRTIWLRPNQRFNSSNHCMAGFQRIRDVYMERIASAILPNVLKVQRELDIH